MPLRLEQHPLLAGVGRSEIDGLLASARVVSVGRGELLARPGDLRHHLLLVLDGYLQSYQLTDDDGRILFEVIGPGGFDAAIGVMGGAAHYTEAVASSVVASVGKAEIDRLVRGGGPFASNLAAALANRLANRENQLGATALRDPSKRLARQLLALAAALGEDGGDGDAASLAMHITHQQLADMLGLRRETVTIHLHQLADAGAVDSTANGLKVSRGRLRAVLDGRRRAAGH